jgi:uncharacterized protein YlaI
MNVYNRVIERLEEFEFEPTDRRTSQVYFTVMSGQLLTTHYPTDEEIDAIIKDLFNFKRIKNTELAKFMVDEKEVIKYTDKWIYLKDF